jgi:hypothetical protein
MGTQMNKALRRLLWRDVTDRSDCTCTHDDDGHVVDRCALCEACIELGFVVDVFGPSAPIVDRGALVAGIVVDEDRRVVRIVSDPPAPAAEDPADVEDTHADPVALAVTSRRD